MNHAAESTSSDLLAAFVSAYPGYVKRRCDELGYEVTPSVDRSIAEGTHWLEAALADTLFQRASDQQRGPLEIFQEALRFPNDALEAAAVPAPDRDMVAVAALPGDRYDLAPASSQAIGTQAWRAHVAWGVDKAKTVAGMVPAPGDARHDAGPRRPRVALVGTDLMDRARIEGPVAASGYQLLVWRNPAAMEEGLDSDRPPLVALVDLTHPTSDDAIRIIAEAGVPVFAFGPHVDDIALARARSLGAKEALPRSRFFRRLPELLPTIV